MRLSVSVVLVVLCCWPKEQSMASPVTFGRVKRSSVGGEAASSYVYFSRTPGSYVFPVVATGSRFGDLPTLVPEPEAFFPAKVLKSVPEFGGDQTGEEFGKSFEQEEPDHDAYRVVEDKHYDHDNGEHDDDDDERKEKHQSSGGSAYGVDHHGRKGSRVEQGYDKKHSIDQANRGSHGKEDHSHRYGEDGSRKKSHHDEASHYHDHHQEAKRTKGGKHHEKKHHQKGSKTTGYHNVYHKDEYKKEHVFYDTSDHTGQFKRYGSAHQHHADESGHHGAGGHEDRGHEEAHYQRAGSKDQGSYDQQHRQHADRHGKEQHHQDGTHYDHKQHVHSGAGEGGYKIFHH